MKVGFNALKLCYDVFNEQDGLYFAPTPSINPTPTPPLHSWVKKAFFDNLFFSI